MEEISKKLKETISKYCGRRIALGLCSDDECEFCAVDTVYYMAKKDSTVKRSFKVFNINYSVTAEDVDDLIDEDKTSEKYDKACAYEIQKIKERLPKKLVFIVPSDEIEDNSDLDDILCDMISDRTGYMVESFEFHELITHGNHTFEVVEAVPPGYLIWNIGDMGNGYLPLCKLKQKQSFEGSKEIEPDSLKAIKMYGTHEILQVVPYGYDSKDAVKQMSGYLAKHPNPSPNTREWTIVSRIHEALPFMQEIVWE